MANKDEANTWLRGMCQLLLVAWILEACVAVDVVSRCPIGCTEHGTCFEELRRCDCPKQYSGLSCSKKRTAADLEKLCTADHGFSSVEQCLSDDLPCVNQCNWRGKCVAGFCHCEPGYYGADCSLSYDAASGKTTILAGLNYNTRRKRPLVYVYELPPEFYVWQNPARLDRHLVYPLWQRLLSSGIRTADGDAADYYFIPLHIRRPGDTDTIVAAVEYIRKMWPWWDKHHGARHIFTHIGDEGARELGKPGLGITQNSTWLHYWGLHQDKHIATSGTIWRAAHTPGKDIVLPVFFSIGRLSAVVQIQKSPLHPAAPRTDKNVTLMFAGRICGDRQPPRLEYPHCRTPSGYSAGVREKVFEHHHHRPDFVVTTSTKGKESLQSLYSRSKFCLAPPGGGHGHRQILSTFMNCIPVSIGDNILEPFEPELDWSQFAVRVAEADVPKLNDILGAIKGKKLEKMQAALRCAAQHMAYSSIIGGFQHESGAYDAVETTMEILRVRLLYPNARPEEYRDLDEEYRKFMDCESNLPLEPVIPSQGARQLLSHALSQDGAYHHGSSTASVDQLLTSQQVQHISSDGSSSTVMQQPEALDPTAVENRRTHGDSDTTSTSSFDTWHGGSYDKHAAASSHQGDTVLSLSASEFTQARGFVHDGSRHYDSKVASSHAAKDNESRSTPVRLLQAGDDPCTMAGNTCLCSLSAYDQGAGRTMCPAVMKQYPNAYWGFGRPGGNICGFAPDLAKCPRIWQ